MLETEKSLRIKKTKISTEFLENILKKVTVPYTSDLPEDAKILWVKSSENGFVEVVFSSIEFEPIKIYDIIPSFEIIVTKNN